MSKAVLRVYCPVCGYHHPVTYWAKMPAMEPTSFGYIQKSLGRAKGFKTVGELHIGDAPEVFEEIKKRMFGVLAYWFEKGLISRSEVEMAFNYVEGLKNRVSSRLWWESAYIGRKRVGVRSQNFWSVVKGGG